MAYKSFSMNKKIGNNLNMATTPMLKFIRPPEILEIGGDIEKFLEECDRFFELTQTAEEHRGLFIKAFLSTEAIRKYEESEGEGDYKKRIEASFLKPINLGDDLNETLKYRREDSMTVFVRKIEIVTKNILRHKLNEENLKIFLFRTLWKITKQRKI